MLSMQWWMVRLSKCSGLGVVAARQQLWWLQLQHGKRAVGAAAAAAAAMAMPDEWQRLQGAGGSRDGPSGARQLPALAISHGWQDPAACVRCLYHPTKNTHAPIRRAGVRSLIIGGTTGEGHLMSWDEHIMLIAHTVNQFGREVRGMQV